MPPKSRKRRFANQAASTEKRPKRQKSGKESGRRKVNDARHVEKGPDKSADAVHNVAVDPLTSPRGQESQQIVQPSHSLPTTSPTNTCILVDFEQHRGNNSPLGNFVNDRDQWGVGFEGTGQCVEGLGIGEQATQVSRPPVNTSIFDPIGAHVPQLMREKIWESSYIDLALLLKQSRDLRTEAHTTGEIILKNGQLVIEKQHLKPLNNIQAWTTAYTEVYAQHPLSGKQSWSLGVG